MLKKYYLTLLFSICAFYNTFGQCISPTNLIVTNVSESSAVLGWTENGTATQWEVTLVHANLDLNDPSGMHYFVTANPFVVTGLMPCTSYKYYVRSICNVGIESAWVGPCYFATNSVLAVDCPPMAQNDSMTVYPNNVSITFSNVSVLANDFLLGMPANTSNVILTPLSIPANFSLNPNGTVNVLPGTAPGTYTLTYTICAVQNSSNCSTATATITVANEGFLMKAFVDANSNGIQDLGETNFNLGQFHYQVNNNGITNSISTSDGTYYLQESNTTNSYDLSYTVDSNFSSYYTVSPSSYNDINFVSGSGVMVCNFPITQLPYTDTNVSVMPYGVSPRPGFTYQNKIAYQNSGNQLITSGTVTFTKSNTVSIISVSEAGIISTATGFTYDFTNLLPNETRYIYVTMQVPTIPTVALGDLVTNTASITIPSAGDVTLSNNASFLTQTIVGSYDPNDKTESHGEKIVHASFTSNDYLTYTIQFENTGTFYAENVRISDVLDAKLDETSVRMINASHSNVLSRVGNTLNWNMNGIDLLPSAKGHVTFQIKPKPGYAIGDIIPNTASIFFDFNPAIITNTFQTEFVNTMSVSEFENATYSVYPNPTNSSVTISGKDNSQIDSVVITDISGKTVQTKMVNMVTAKIDLSDLSNGIYFAKVKSGNNLNIVKIIKQ